MCSHPGRQFLTAEDILFTGGYPSYGESLDAGIQCFLLAIEVGHYTGVGISDSLHRLTTNKITKSWLPCFAQRLLSDSRYSNSLLHIYTIYKVFIFCGFNISVICPSSHWNLFLSAVIIKPCNDSVRIMFIQYFKKFHEALTFLNRAADLQKNVSLCLLQWYMTDCICGAIETWSPAADNGRDCSVQDTIKWVIERDLI